MALQQAFLAVDAGKHRGNDDGAHRAQLRYRRPIIAAAVLFLAAMFGAPAHAQYGPFAGLTGRWSGGGTVSLDDGSTERIRCRAAYAVAGPRLAMTLLCASDSYRFELQANAVAEGADISGTWSEASRGVTGTLQGRGGGGNIDVTASAAGFDARISLTTRGNRQSVVLRADSQFRGATINLTR